MASKYVELKVAMDNVPIGAGENELIAEIQKMLQKEYADGVKITVSVIDKPKPADTKKADTKAA
jgi:hypothetical protein